MYTTMSPVNLLVLLAAMLSWNVLITGRPITNTPISAKDLGLSYQDFEDYKSKAIKLKELIATFNNVTINQQDQTPEFDDMILPLDIVETLIERYNELLEERNNKRKKRKILEFKLYRPEYKWVFSQQKPIIYTTILYSKKDDAKIDKAFKYWEKHTCIRFKKIKTNGETDSITDYHIQVQNTHGCKSVVGRNIYQNFNNYQTITLGLLCTPLLGVAIHEIGHTLGLFHEQMKLESKDFITINKTNMNSHVNRINFLPMKGIVSLGVPYDLNSIMHYSGLQGSKLSGDSVLVTKDPLYQHNMGQRVELSFLDKKIMNLEYCKDSCPKILPCKRSGYTNPNNCKKCVCPDGFGGKLCQTVGDVHHKACQKPQIIKVTDTEQCITMGTYKPFTECHWHLQADSCQKIEVYFKNDFGVYCNNMFSCFDWIEVKYKGDFSMPGPRFCCTERPTSKLLSDAGLVVVSFKSNHHENRSSSMTTGFQLCYKLGGCSENELLTCNTMNNWEISTEPALNQTIFQRAINGCPGVVKARKSIRFIINLIGGRPFKIDKLCVKRHKARAVVLFLEFESLKKSTLVMHRKTTCLDCNTFTNVGLIRKLTIEVQAKRDMTVSDIILEVCKQ